MPETFTITAVGDEARVWNSDQYGSFHIWPVDYTSGNVSGKAERKVKADSPKPTVGESFEGELKERPGYASELKKLPKQHGGGGGQSRSPEKEAEITRMHSQEMAIRWAAVLQASGQWPTDASPEQRRATLVALIDFFQADAASTKGAS